MFSRLRLFPAVALVLMLAAASRHAAADTFTYNYTGAAFSAWYNSSCPAQCSLTGSITFAAQLPGSLPYATFLSSVDAIVGYSFSDGLNTFTQTNSTFSDAYGQGIGNSPFISTDGAGQITGWGFALTSTAGVEMVSTFAPGSTGHDNIIINTPFGLNLQAGASAPGTWSGPVDNPGPPAPVPEPSTLVLVGAVALFGIVRRRHPRG